MTREKIKTGLIGIGKVGHIHAYVLKKLTESIFSGVYHREYERAKVFADKYGVIPYSDIDEMIKVGGIQAVVIATPHPAHAEPAIATMNAGAHVMVEKPLASSLEDCDAMITAAKNTKKKLAMISQRRLYEPVKRIKIAIDAGKLDVPVLGTVSMFGWRDKNYYDSDLWRGTWSKEGGGVLVNQAPHQIDILQWIMGPVDELYGYWANLNHPYIEVEDTSIAILKFTSGALGNIVVSNSQNPALYGKIAIYGKNGSAVGVQTDGGAMFVAGMSKITEPPINDLWTISGEEKLLKKWQKDDSDFFLKIDASQYYHELQIKDFLNAIIQDRDPLVTGEDGRKTVEIFVAIYRSQRDKKAIKFPLTYDKNDDFNGRLTIEDPKGYKSKK